MADFPYRRAVVVGVGLLGGSIALALQRRRLAATVVGVVRSAARVDRALASGVVSEATTDLAAACRGADLVCVAAPVDAIPDLALAAAAAAPEALVTDAGSTKASIVERIDDGWPTGSATRFVGAHPLAGGHQSGPEAAREDLFDGATTILTPSERTAREALAEARRLWQGLGSTVVEMAPRRHDALLALSSHVPHVAAAAVAATTPDEALELTATGWADTTRVASGAAGLWREILLQNAGPVSAGLRELQAEIERYVTALDAGDDATLERLLEQGRQKRDAVGS